MGRREYIKRGGRGPTSLLVVILSLSSLLSHPLHHSETITIILLFTNPLKTQSYDIIIMDYLKKASESFSGEGSSDNSAQNQQQQSGGQQQETSGGGFLSGIGNKLNSAAGGGKESEKNEDYLDKGMFLHFAHLYTQSK